MHLFVASLQRLQAQPPHPRQKGTVKEQTGVSPLSGLSQEPHLVPQQATVDRVTWLPTQARLGEAATVGWNTGRLGAEWEPSSVPTGWGQDGPQAAHSTHPTEGGSWGRCEQ